MTQIETSAPTAITPPDAGNPTWGSRDVVLGLALYGMLIAAAVGGLRVATMTGVMPAAAASRETSLIVAAFAELAMLLPVWLVAIVMRHSTWRSLGFRDVQLGTGCLLVPAAFCGSLAINASWGLFIRQMGWDTQVDIAGLFGTSPFAIIFGFVTVAIFAPIAEETLFRGFVLGGLRRRFGTLGALLISSALFTLPHLPPTIYPAIFGLGFLFGLLYLQTKSLIPSILVHALINGLAYSVQVYCSLNNCKLP